ncbi:MAG: transporter substrate-binding domain-containing protein [Candidatus Thalassarchaeaceae archaeon]|jgi:general L-amino acid transport system substrate-binding protein|nr:transporter substrate-binding domain-containing protein [Candidatus Thalassarchaeaceae archaeon]
MERTITILMIIMLTSVSLAGCAGDDANYEETISTLEQEAIADQGMLATLNATVASLEGNIAQLDSDIATLNSRIADLDTQIGDYQAQAEILNQQNATKATQIDLMALNITTLETTKASLETQLSALELTKATLEAQVSLLESEKVNLEGQVASLTTANQNSASEVSDLQDLAAELNETIEQLEDTISEMESDSSSGDFTSTLDTIISRGYMICGVKESQYGMGYLDSATGVRSGLDISYCRAVAAAIGLNPDTDIEYIPTSASMRFQLLADETIDVLIRTTTWTTSRDSALDADYAAVNFYDGQGLLIRSDAFAYGNGSMHQLDGSTICVGADTTSEGNLDAWFYTQGISFTSVSIWDSSDAIQKLKDGVCDAWTGDMSAMVAMKWTLETHDDHEDWRNSGDYSDLWIAAETISKEPLAAATRDYDSKWNEIVSWVWYGMVTAEELGVTSENYDTLDYSCTWSASNYNAWLCRLLEENLGLGTDDNPLSMYWMQDVLEEVGNYGEAYDDAFCDGTYDGVSGSDAMTGCLLSRSGSLNALVSEGGIQYAPSMR